MVVRDPVGTPGEPEGRMRPDETTVPVLPCVSAEETLAFYRALGFEVTYEQTRPYLYLAFRWSGFDLHFGRAPEGLDPALENSGGCLVMVDEVAPYHAELTRAMRAAYGKVLARGLPRITRHRPGASRFTLMDPSGNSIIFIRRDEPAEPEYGGSASLEGLARALDQVRIFREFKNDDEAAYRRANSALRRHGDGAPAADRALAYATLVELSVARGDEAQAREWRAMLAGVELTEEERERVGAELGSAEALRAWLDGDGGGADRV
ncbi:glyoxalase [Nocardiopsis sp. NPDC006198]|uniref:glyoxalase n=1 Tax=Nocardiopsis sp. NPDC006198 TaxID=3154472 RepID=UPI0033BC557C